MSGSCDDCRKLRVEAEYASKGSVGNRAGLNFCGLL
jgi:hypothetical protein